MVIKIIISERSEEKKFKDEIIFEMALFFALNSLSKRGVCMCVLVYS